MILQPISTGLANASTSYTLTIQSPTGSGSTSPGTGARTYQSGTSVTVIATPSSGYNFDHWIKDGTDAGNSNPIYITMSSSHTLKAVYTQSSSIQLKTSTSSIGLGINYRTDYLSDSPTRFAANFALFKSTGMDRISVVLYWGTYESSKGNYIASEYTKLRHVLQAAASAGLKVHLDFHTLFPSSTSGFATPTNLGGNTRLILSGSGKTQYLNWIRYTMQKISDLPIESVAVLNEPSRYSLTTTQKSQTVQLWTDARAVVKSIMPNVLVGVRFDLSGLKQFTTSQTIDTLDIAFVNEYLDHRNPSYTVWGSGWSNLQSYINTAHAKGKQVEVTEWNGYATTPVITVDYMSGHMTKLDSIGADAAYFWGWKGTTSWVWDLAKSGSVTPKVNLNNAYTLS
jgi:hypothetical protein